jgi:hypothetical protein
LRRIAPGARHQPGAIGRRARIDRFDHAAQVVGREHALLDQQFAHRLGHQLVVVVGMVLDVRLVRMRVIVRMCGHGAGSSQCS